MLFFTSSLDQAADNLLAARFKLTEAERRGGGVETAQRELAIAEAAWQAVCDGVRAHARTNVRKKVRKQGAGIFPKRTFRGVHQKLP